MIDERGRGGNLPPDVERVCALALFRAIYDQAVYDQAVLDAHGANEKQLGSDVIYRSELDAFFGSDWGKFIKQVASRGKYNADRIRKKALHRARIAYDARYKSGNVRKFAYKGEELYASEWGARLGVTPSYVVQVYNDRDGEENPDTWLDGVGEWRGGWIKHSYQGKMMTAGEIAKSVGLLRYEVQTRLKRGMTPEQAITAAFKWREKHPKQFESKENNRC